MQQDNNISRLEKFHHKKRIKRIKQVCIIIAILIFVSIFVYTDLGNAFFTFISDTSETIELNLNKGDGFPVDNIIENYIQSEELSNSIAVLDSQKLLIVSPSGAILNTTPHTYAVPRITVSDKRLCLYNQGGKNMIIKSRQKHIAEKSFEQPIYFAQYSNNGNLAVVTKNEKFKANLTVFASGFEELFTFKLADDYPLNLSFAKDNKTIALGCISSDNGLLKSTTYILNITNEDITTVEYSGEIPIYSRFLTNERLLVCFENNACVYNYVTGVTESAYSYPDKLIGISKDNSLNTVFLFGHDKQLQRNVMVLLDDNLKEITKQYLNFMPSNASITEGNIYVYSKEKLISYDLTTFNKEEIPLDNNILDLVCAKDIFVVDNKKINILK